METIGKLVDQLITVSMKLYHTEDIAHNPETTIENVGKAKLRINVLNNQRNGLIEEIDTLFEDVLSGTKRIPKVFRQLKDYGVKKI